MIRARTLPVCLARIFAQSASISARIEIAALVDQRPHKMAERAASVNVNRAACAAIAVFPAVCRADRNPTARVASSAGSAA